MSKTTKKMECGCVRGHFLCPTAHALWELHNACYKADMPTLAAYFRGKYNDHFAEYTPELEGESSCTPT